MRRPSSLSPNGFDGSFQGALVELLMIQVPANSPGPAAMAVDAAIVDTTLIAVAMHAVRIGELLELMATALPHMPTTGGLHSLSHCSRVQLSHDERPRPSRYLLTRFDRPSDRLMTVPPTYLWIDASLDFEQTFQGVAFRQRLFQHGSTTAGSRMHTTPLRVYLVEDSLII